MKSSVSIDSISQYGARYSSFLVKNFMDINLYFYTKYLLLDIIAL